LRILCDVDGVICDFGSRYLDGVYAVTGCRFGPQDVTTWEHRDCLGISKEDDARVLAWVSNRLDFYEIPGAVDAVRALQCRHEVVFVTSPHSAIPTWAHERERWLNLRFPGTPVVHTHHKHLISGDVLIDDRTENVAGWLRAWPGGKGILWAQPYNAGQRPGGMWRTNDWKEVSRIIGDPREESTRIAEARCP
jgi:5'(3')-deoxyribonucleotidase